MAITRKDIVVVTVLFNTVILTCILATARQVSLRHDEVPVEVPHSAEVQSASDQISLEEIDQLLEECLPDVQEQVSKKKKQTTAATNKPSAFPSQCAPSSSLYVVRPGDNPWKIAKQFHISFEKLLELNQLDEAKARNLKVGQTLRIKDGHE